MSKKILFIYPSYYTKSGEIVKSKKLFILRRTLPYLAAITPKYFQTYIIEELIDDIDFNLDVDLIALTGCVFNIPRAIHIAKGFKRRGKRVIIGGIGAFSLKEDLINKNVFDSIIIGEVDEVWDDILNDFLKKEFRPVYICPRPKSLNNLPNINYSLLNLKKYVKINNSYTITIETSRSCPHKCEFCSVYRYFGNKMRFRPINEIISEIKSYNLKNILFTDDNLTINQDRAIELFKALKTLKIRWSAQCEKKIVENSKLLKLAKESGCHTIYMGIETLNEKNVKLINKFNKNTINPSEINKILRNYNIHFVPTIIIGMDYDTVDSIRETYKYFIDINVPLILPSILTPYPNTSLYERYMLNDNILHNNYSLYNGINAVIKPNNMTPKILEYEYWKGFRKFYNIKNIIFRILKEKDKLNSIIYNYSHRKSIKFGFHPAFGIIPHKKQ